MKKLLLGGLLVLHSCSSQLGLTGLWQDDRYSLVDRGWAFLGGYRLKIKSQLLLHADSTWSLNGNCQVFTGSKWKESRDSLFLFPDTAWFADKRVQNRTPALIQAGGFLAYRRKKNTLEKKSLASYCSIGKNDSLVKHHMILYEVFKQVK